MSFDGDGDAGWVFVFCYCLVRILTLPPLFEKLSREMTYLLDLSGHTVVWRTGSESIRPLSAAGLGQAKGADERRWLLSHHMDMETLSSSN